MRRLQEKARNKMQMETGKGEWEGGEDYSHNFLV